MKKLHNQDNNGNDRKAIRSALAKVSFTTAVPIR